MVQPLYEINAGETAQVVWVISEPAMSGHLERLGFVSHEPVTCILKGTCGNLSAYQIQGNVIALRPSTAKEILVRFD